ncbi:unnamed protein product [Orchesella dallaii]
MLETAKIVDTYYTPLLFLFGTVGNSLSLLVFCMNAKYRSQSASYYLSALAISDTGFLVNLLAVWLEGVHGGVITSGLMCPLVMYLGQVTCFMSVYLTVAFSIERYVAVHYPLARPRICTCSKARKVIAALTAIALIVFSYAWVIARVIELPPKADGYEDLYQDLLPTTNFTEESPQKILPFPDGRREKVTFPSQLPPVHSQLLTLNGLKARSENAFRNGQNCGTGNDFVHNNSLNLQVQNESLNCSRMHLNEMTTRDSRHFSLSRESSEDSSFSMETMLEVEKYLAENEQNFSTGFYICTVPEGYYRISEIANYLDSVVTLIIPFFLITFFNVRIATCVWKLKNQRQSIVASSAANINHHHSLRCSNKSSIHHSNTARNSRSGSSTRRNHLSKQPQYSGTSQRENGQKPLSTRLTIKPEFSVVRERISSHHPASNNAAEVRVTKTLLLVSTVFLVLNLPAHAIRCAHRIQALRGTSEGQDFLEAAQVWTNILFNTNFAVNFLLYCVSGRNFRKSLKNIILRKFSRAPTVTWKSGKNRNKDRTSFSVRMPVTKRNCLNELQVTEIVELEERTQDVSLTLNCNTADVHCEGEDEEETMSV